MEKAGKVVLVVDDNRDGCEALAMLLELNGFVVKQANSAEQALSVLQSSPVDLIVTDINMSGMNGFELAKETLVQGYDMGVVFMSGLPKNEEIFLHLAQQGVITPKSSFLLKPLSIELLEKAMEELM